MRFGRPILYLLSVAVGIAAAGLAGCGGSPSPADEDDDLVLGFIPPIPATQAYSLPEDIESPLVQGPSASPDDHAGPSEGPAPSGDVVDATITVHADRQLRLIPDAIYGTNLEWVFDANGLWDPVAGEPRADIVELTRTAGFTLLRFPGGVFSDYYHWQDGVGPPEVRATTEHYPGGPVSTHRFGTDEALDFARRTGGALLITVNAGTGTAGEAADWVRYVRDRAPQLAAPAVRYWEIGNELYINDDSVTNAPITTPPDVYAARVLDFAAQMRAADPNIRIGAIGGESQGAYIATGYADWNATVLAQAGDVIDFLAVHNAYAPMIYFDDGVEVTDVYRAMLAAPLLVRQNLQTIGAQIDAYVPHRANGISLAITEWGPYFHLEPSSRFVDHVKTLGSALYVGSVLKVFIEDPRVELANAFKLIDNAWMGWIGVRDSAYLAKAPAMAMQMYRQHFGERLVETEVVAPVASSPALGIVDAVAQVPQLECVSSLSNDGETLYLMVINKSFDTAITTRIDLAGFEAGGATVHTLNGTAIDANTGTQLPQIPGVKWARQATASPDGRFHFGRPGEVTIQSAEADLKGARLLCVFPAHSMTAVELRKQPVMRDE